MTNDKKPELKPCPFCGETAKLWSDNKVSCTNPGCGCFRSAIMDNAAPFYIEGWNTRAGRHGPELADVREVIQSLRTENDDGTPLWAMTRQEVVSEQLDQALAILDRKIGGA